MFWVADIKSLSFEEIANQMSCITNDPNNPALLWREKDYFIDKIQKNLISVMLDDDWKIVASWLISPIGNWFAEVWSVYVDRNYRWIWLWKWILNWLNILLEEHDLVWLLTMKPNEPWSWWMIVDATSCWYIPVSYDFLMKYELAFKNCCVCNTCNIDMSCVVRDNKCILWVQKKLAWVKESSLRFINSPDFNSAISDERLKSRVLSNISRELCESLI